MYETEINDNTEKLNQLPDEAVKLFAAMRQKSFSRTVLPWSEHCTECVWPTCYSTCDLYSARKDGKCRRFVDGMVRLEADEAVNGYLLKIRFKRWGKLWTPGNIRLFTAEEAEKREKNDYRIGHLLQRVPAPSLVSIKLAQKRYGFKKRSASAGSDYVELPTSFLLECYNPEPLPVSLSLTMRSASERGRMPFQKLIELTPGFQRVRVPVKEIVSFVDLRQSFDIELVPNSESETTLYFGLIDFVKEAVQPRESKSEGKKIKCVVWDLDNTLWDGVLVEDGPAKLRLKPEVAAIIESLDQRGILHSIASKNNAGEASEAVERFKLKDYFLYPQISWQPKSQAIKRIAEQLNIGLDTLLFVDDSPFELEEVKTVCPEVRILNAAHYRSLLEMKECQVPVTAESRERRKMYQVEMDRQSVAEGFGDDYMTFLRHCQIRLNICPMTEENLERVHELTQRTNQMNFSGNRYDREVLREILRNPDLETCVLSCEDRFGSYGVIGFSLVNRREPRMTDLMFSCRVQSKRVEHAFLAYIIRKSMGETGKDFYANYRKTPRNAPSGKVFEDMGMEEVETRDGVSSLVFRRGREVPDDGVIEIVAQEPVSA